MRNVCYNKSKGEYMKYFISNAFTHGIGEYFEEETWKKLESIFSTGGLYSKNKRDELSIKHMVGRVMNHHEASDDVVSLLDLSDSIVKKRIEGGRAKCFLPYNENVITLIISPEIEKQESERFFSCELHVKDEVPLSYFNGIIVPDDKECQRKVFDTLEKFNISLPVFNFDGERLYKNKINEIDREL
jgi:hypothetical protein